MGSFGFSKDLLANMRLSQLRELARQLGVWRYSNMLREQLVSAIHLRSPQAEPAATTATEAAAPRASDPPFPVLEPSGFAAGEPSPGLGDVAGDQGSQAVEAGSTWLSLAPQDHQWALVRWAMDPRDRQRALAAGGQELCLRLTEVSANGNGGGLPHALQQVVVASDAVEWHLPVPLGDRDYRVELGYRTANGGWISLAFSPVAHMPAEAELPFESLASFGFAALEEGAPWSPPLPAPGLHERLYQKARASRLRPRQGSEVFHEHGDHALAGAGGQLSGAGVGGHASGAGLWASGREASGAGLPIRERSFWLVADAELIVYGATDPSATLNVGEQVVPLAEDGTFSFHATFPDGEQHYPIRALAADGEQKRSITLDFRRTTPHAVVNTREEAVAEWF
jgi:hypothetical protein